MNPKHNTEKKSDKPIQVFQGLIKHSKSTIYRHTMLNYTIPGTQCREGKETEQ